MRLLTRLAIVAAALAAAPLASAAFSLTVNTASPITAPGVTLSGDDQSKTFTMQYTVANTGGGSTTSGWKVQASATVPTSSSGTLPALKVTGVTSTCSVSCTVNPSNNVALPVTMTTTAQRIFNAAANTGLGTFSLTSTWQLTYPANAKSGTYSSTVTVTLSTSP